MLERVGPAVRMILVLVGAIVLQTVLAPRLAISGAQADLFLVSVVLVAAARGSFEGAIFAFIAGLAADVVFMDPLGLHVFIYLVAGYVAGRITEQLGFVNVWLAAALLGGLALVSQFAYGAFQFIANPHGGFLTMLQVQILPSTLLGVLLGIPFYWLLARLGVIEEEQPRLSFR